MRTRCIVAAMIFGLLTFIKLTIPGGAEFLREERERYMAQNTDFSRLTALFLQPEETENTSAVQRRLRPVKTEDDLRPSYTFQTLSQVHAQRLPSVQVPATETLTEKVALSFAQEETVGESVEIIPEAVQVFLDSQADFSAYALPANVSYEMPELPFEFAPPVSGYNSSGFGYRLHPVYNEVKFHYGTDVAACTGEAIYAFADGTVTTAAYSDSYGNYVVISHIGGWQSLYAHCSQLKVQSGETIRCGDLVALVGATGVVTGPHLHFELTHDGIYTNPEYYVNYA